MTPSRTGRDHRRIVANPGRFLVAMAITMLLAAATAPTAAAQDLPGVALDPTSRSYTLTQIGCADHTVPGWVPCETMMDQLATGPDYDAITFGEVQAEVRSGPTLRSDCAVKPQHVGWASGSIRCFSSADTATSEWFTQGLAGSEEYRTSNTPGRGSPFMIATWCYRGGASKCTDETEDRTRISVIDHAVGRYKNVTLSQMIKTHGQLRPWNLDFGMHAGGAAVAGPYLYVSDTTAIHQFDLRRLLRSGSSRTLTIPRVASHVLPSGSPNLFSSISIDGSNRSAPALVAVEYEPDRSNEAIVSRWPLTSAGDLRHVVRTGAKVTSSAIHVIDGDSDIDRVQGVVATNGRYLFSTSDQTIERARVGVVRSQADKCIRWGGGVPAMFEGDRDNGPAEDLYHSPREGFVAGINERSGNRAFWMVDAGWAFGTVKPPFTLLNCSPWILA